MACPCGAEPSGLDALNMTERLRFILPALEAILGMRLTAVGAQGFAVLPIQNQKHLERYFRCFFNAFRVQALRREGAKVSNL